VLVIGYSPVCDEDYRQRCGHLFGKQCDKEGKQREKVGNGVLFKIEEKGKKKEKAGEEFFSI